MKTGFVRGEQLQRIRPFVLESIRAVMRAVGEEVDASEYFSFIDRANTTGQAMVIVQFDGDKPLGICVSVFRRNDVGQQYLEIVLVYNMPQVNATVVLEKLLIPAARSLGVELLVDRYPMVDQKENPVLGRRMRKYGFNKKAVLCERRI